MLQTHDMASHTVTLGRLRYIDTVFLGWQNHDNQIDAKFEKNLVHDIEFGRLLLNEWEYIEKCLKNWLF